jgi:hypothetical protein
MINYNGGGQQTVIANIWSMLLTESSFVLTGGVKAFEAAAAR